MKKLFESTEFERDYHYSGTLGVKYSKNRSTFEIYAPMADKAWLNLYNGEKCSRIPMLTGKKGTFYLMIYGDMHGCFYTYDIERNGKITTSADPYAVSASVNGEKSMVVDLEKTNPEGFLEEEFYKNRPDKPVIYELHVKDFSYDENSGIPKEHRGKFAAFTHKDTMCDGEKTGISYLKDLGITHVHLLPVFDYASVDEAGDDRQFNWGYDPLNYMVPEGSYATDPHDGVTRIKEMKAMVKSLHEAGIGVIMDVVYNHTYSLDSVFEKTLPGYFYRQFEDDTYSDGSACGNETASERSMFRKYIIDSVLYWAKEYHIDGFRFDLMGLTDTETMNQLRKSLNEELPNGDKILLYGEPWTAAESPMKTGSIPAVKANIDHLDKNIAIFCDNTRDAIKGSVFEAKEKGFVTGKKHLEEEIVQSVAAWVNGCEGFPVHEPSQIISYVSAHDNYTLWDKLMLSMYKKPDFLSHDKDILKINKLTAAIVFTCFGIPFFQAGEEFARTKSGDENSYKSSPEINMLSWKRKNEYMELVEYYKGLISLRKNFPTFYEKSGENVMKSMKVLEKKGHLVSFILNSINENDVYEKLLITYNASDKSKKIKIDGNYYLLGDSKGIYVNHETEPMTGTVTVKAKEALILCTFK